MSPRSRTRATKARRRPRAHPRGILKASAAGHAFVSTSEGEFFIPASKSGGAFDGDVVEVAEIQSERAHAQGQQHLTGRVVRVVFRARECVVGRYEVAEPFGVVVPDDPHLTHDVFTMRADAPHVRDGDIVRVRLTSYPTRHEPAQGVVEEVLGHEGDAGVDVDLIAARHGFDDVFSQAALQQARDLSHDAAEALADPRYADFTDRITFTVDPSDAKDFDDALSADFVEGDLSDAYGLHAIGVPDEQWARFFEPGVLQPVASEASSARGCYLRLGVHIADVSHYVPWGTPLDAQARRRATSVYLVDRVVPMLPEELSNDICSLRPGELRRVVSVDMFLDAKGAIRRCDITPAVIRSRARLSYDDVQAAFDAAGAERDVKRAADALPALSGARAEDLARRLFAANAAAVVMHAARQRQGGMDFENEEAKVRLDEAGQPLSVDIRHATDATRMVEAAMIAANEAVARFLLDAGTPTIYRVHEAPDAGDLMDLVPILQELGYERAASLSAFGAGEPAAIQDVLAAASGRPECHVISSLVIRAMKRAVYSDACEPHFGLASSAYLHFTSPIRRYPDLMVHRAVKEVLWGPEPSSRDMRASLSGIAMSSSAAQREADEAARESQELKLYELVARRVGMQEWGVVSGVTPSGFFVRLSDTAEGFVSLRGAGEFFVFEPSRLTLTGADSNTVYRIGMRVQVRIAAVHPRERRADFELAAQIR